MRELQQARELPITLIELTTEVLPAMEGVNAWESDDVVVHRLPDEKFAIYSRTKGFWTYNNRTGEYIPMN